MLVICIRSIRDIGHTGSLRPPWLDADYYVVVLCLRSEAFVNFGDATSGRVKQPQAMHRRQ